MNPLHLILIGALLIAFIMMGKNPFEAPEGYIAPDEFKEGIKTQISKTEKSMGSFGGMPGGSGASMSNYGALGGRQGVNTPIGSPRNQKHYGIGAYNSQDYKQGTANSRRLPSLGGLPARNNDPFNNGTQKTPNKNLPEPFQNLPNTQNSGGGASLYHFPGMPNVRTDRGAPIRFSGSKVFTVNDKGKQVLMADGEHHLSSGQTITVKRGRSIFTKKVKRFN